MVEEKKFYCVTDLEMGEMGLSCHEVMRARRGRWKIENECFNCLKNLGYRLGHNYGHGKENLSLNEVIMMILSFMIEQIFEIKNGLYKKARKVWKYRTYLWRKIREGYQWREFTDWEELLGFLIEWKEPAPDTS